MRTKPVFAKRCRRRPAYRCRGHAWGIDTRLGEGGLGLSGGQSRRLALARLFLRDTPLWLLDEPTEGLDGVTARDVLARLSAMAAGRSLVIATHIRREAAIADRIAVIEGGRITEISRRGGRRSKGRSTGFGRTEQNRMP